MSISPRQQAIVDQVLLGSSLLVQACAGSGKTHTLGLICQAVLAVRPRTRIVALAFNKEIADEFKTRLPLAVTSCTTHSLGFRAVSKAYPAIQLDNRKMRRHIKQTVASIEDPSIRDSAESDLHQFLPLVRDLMLDPDKHDDIVINAAMLNKDISVPETSTPLVAVALRSMAADTTAIDYAEMLYWPASGGFRLPVYDLVLIDEAQDLSPAQHALLGHLLRPGTQLVAVGDRKQSIYAFRGADAASMDRLQQKYSLHEMPLDVSYRCPRKVVQIAQSIVGPGIIESAEDASDGVVTQRSEKDLEKTMLECQGGELVLCRTNAPLFAFAMNLLSCGTPAIVRGRDLGTQLARRVERTQAEDVPALIKAIAHESQEKIEQLRAADADESAIEAELDMRAVLLAVCEDARSVAEVSQRLRILFDQDEAKNPVICSTIHRAKGLQARTVVVLGGLAPTGWERSGDAGQAAQERHLRYVAATRSQDRLILQPLKKS